LWAKKNDKNGVESSCKNQNVGRSSVKNHTRQKRKGLLKDAGESVPQAFQLCAFKKIRSEER